jgi:hypothetical protein
MSQNYSSAPSSKSVVQYAQICPVDTYFYVQQHKGAKDKGAQNAAQPGSKGMEPPTRFQWAASSLIKMGSSCRHESALSDFPASKKPYTSGNAFIEYMKACSVDILQVGRTAHALATENL